MLNQAQKDFYQANGYLKVDSLFSPQEVDFYKNHYMRLREETHEGDFSGVNSSDLDPLKKYPRMIHMHRWDKASLDWMIDPRINTALIELLGKEPFAVQTMLYFKPAGARGQALHQDNYYLRVQPGTCMAAWLALDDCDEENGCMQVVPGSHDWPILCPIGADTTQSFTDVTVPLPEGTPVHPAIMKAGDVLFFNGSIVHGSFPNTSKDRFRRSLIGHYIEGDAQQVGSWYHPALRMDGSPLELETSPGATQCGDWVDVDGQPVIEVTRSHLVDASIHD
jgi:phytanoyl-CoA hydroxylase